LVNAKLIIDSIEARAQRMLKPMIYKRQKLPLVALLNLDPLFYMCVLKFAETHSDELTSIVKPSDPGFIAIFAKYELRPQSKAVFFAPCLYQIID
jgi:hypothetical protein